MNLLQIKDGKVVDEDGGGVRLRGTCIGGWLNLENFINGFPGVEYTLRQTMTDLLDPEMSEFFFDSMEKYFFSKEDVLFIRECGANVVRIPINYRQLENDNLPFQYRESGFRKLENIVNLCGEHGLYVILDLHSVQGWQNPDWHCDNPTRYGLFWQHPHFQDRFVSLWEEIARRFRGNPAVAGYNVMNEPVTTSVYSRFGFDEKPDWDLLNQVYRRVTGAIRAVDPDHIIILEGDLFSRLFSGLGAPFDDNLMYSSHNYQPPCFGPGIYPGEIGGKYWDRAVMKEVFEKSEGTCFARERNVPLYIGEFGCVFNGIPEEIPYRLKALEDQIGVFEEAGVHWTTWTYKDVGVMGWVGLDPESEYMEVVKPILEAKRLTSVDSWGSWLPETKTREAIRYLARYIEAVLKNLDIQPAANEGFLSQAALANYMGILMQRSFANCFLYRPLEDVDIILQSFALNRCIKNESLLGVIRRFLL
jgi:endoglucanase